MNFMELTMIKVDFKNRDIKWCLKTFRCRRAWPNIFWNTFFMFHYSHCNLYFIFLSCSSFETCIEKNNEDRIRNKIFSERILFKEDAGTLIHHKWGVFSVWAPDEAVAHGVPRIDGSACSERDRLCNPQRSSVERRSESVWRAQNFIQTFYPVEPSWCLWQDICGPDRTGWPFEASDDRCNTPQGTPDIGVPAQKGVFPRHIGRTKGGLNSKLHAVCDDQGRPVRLHLTVGLVVTAEARTCFWQTSLMRQKKSSGTEATTATRSNYRLQNAISQPLFRRRRTGNQRHFTTRICIMKHHLIENRFAKLKNWWRIPTRYDRCAHTFMYVIHIAASAIFYFKEWVLRLAIGYSGDWIAAEVLLEKCDGWFSVLGGFLPQLTFELSDVLPLRPLLPLA